MKTFWVFFILSGLRAQSIDLIAHPYATLGTEKNLTASISSGDLDNDGDIDIVHEVWEEAFGEYFEKFVKQECILDISPDRFEIEGRLAAH